MSDCLVSYRPAFTVDLLAGPCHFTTPVHAHPYLTYVVWMDPMVLRTQAKSGRAGFGTPVGTALRNYRFEKNVGADAASPFTMPVADMYGSSTFVPSMTLHDTDVVDFMIHQGAQEIPIAVRTETKEYMGEFAAMRIQGRAMKSLDDLCRSVPAQTERPAGEEGVVYTNFMPRGEMEQHILANVDNHRRYGRLHPADQHEMRAFVEASERLDQMIFHGVPGAYVINGHDIYKMSDSMQHALRAAGANNDTGQVSPMEWLDRFSALTERHTHYQTLRRLDRSGSSDTIDRVSAMARIVAAHIRRSDAAMGLMSQSFSDQAMEYFTRLVQQERQVTPVFADPPQWGVPAIA